MTAFERAAEDLVSAANGATAPSKSRTVGSGMSAWRAGLALCLSDVLEGMRWVSHNALAMVGLSAVAAALFLMSRPELRHGLETQALSWLTERASVRAGLSSDERSDNEVLLAMAEPEAIQRATAANPAELNRQQSAVAYWISRRYNVAPEPISRLVQEAWQVGQRVGMEPTLVLAVMAVESGFNPFAQSHVGAQGLMQVMTRVHHDKYEIFGGQNAAFDPVTNLRVGVQVLKDCIRRAGSLEGGLKYYVGAANMVDDGGYAAKVLAEQGNLRQVAQGRKVAVNVPLPQPAVTQAASPSAAAPRPEANVGVAPAAAPAASDSAPLPRRVEQVAMLTP
jgi:soluble lytic murein transglycosylase-like protein